LNSYTLGGESSPGYVTPSTSSTSPLVDGWYFKNESTTSNGVTKSTKIQWGSEFVDSNNGYTANLSTNVNQIYFTVYLTQTSGLPFLVLYTPLYTGSSNDWYGHKAFFSYTGTISTAGYYTFVADISGGSNVTPAVMNSTIKTLTYSKDYSSPSSDTFADFKTSISSSPNLYYFTVQTSDQLVSGSIVNTELTLTDINVEMNNVNAYINSGTYKFIFTNAVVANNFLYNALNDLYNQFYGTDIASTYF
jgi:hypothetical protein